MQNNTETDNKKNQLKECLKSADIVLFYGFLII